MCDVMMLAFWVWTIVLWDGGLRDHSTSRLFAAGVLVALTTLTKYFGVCLFPLLIVYALVVDARDWRRWGLALVPPVVILAGYQAYVWHLYGTGGLGGAAAYATSHGSPTWAAGLFRLFSGLSFVGGCVGIVAVIALLIGSKGARISVGLASGASLAVALLLSAPVEYDDFTLTASPFALAGGFNRPSPGSDGPAEWATYWALVGQFVLWVGLGFAVLCLTIDELRQRRDAQTLLLFLWVFGAAVFATYVNWTLNGRSVLPLVPAVSILVVRRLDRKWAGRSWPAWVLPAVLTPALALALAVGAADVAQAEAMRAVAEQAVDEYGSDPNHPLWHRGHWGFQYYMMERAGPDRGIFKFAAGRPAIAWPSPTTTAILIMTLPGRRANSRNSRPRPARG